ncbi:MAG TPA: bifunctional pyr operon transcriptional regulator/uracil phosphoribosyltransferase PyrR [Usitatibacter sp.]|nr:bifunctional pyr operon transcriptional regulator/uracil phosphoribosyltransferase PyrR [Usitatibacter sp.]
MNASLPDPETLIEALATQMRGRISPDAALVGIYTGGVWVAERLHQALGIKVPMGVLAVTLHRDDFGRIGLHPETRSSKIPFDVDGREVVLVDDVLHTGRTIRAALNELFDFGRPAAVRLAVLADREGRELPVAGDFVGARVDVPQDEQLVLSNDNGKLAFTRAKRVKRP